jgi:hypothetical protein
VNVQNLDVNMMIVVVKTQSSKDESSATLSAHLLTAPVMEYKRSPSSYHQESPLASLARNASLRKDKPTTPRIHVESGYSQDGTQQQVSSQEQHTDRYRDYGQHEQGGPFYSPQGK